MPGEVFGWRLLEFSIWQITIHARRTMRGRKKKSSVGYWGKNKEGGARLEGGKAK